MREILRKSGETSEGVFAFFERDGRVLLGLRQYSPEVEVWLPPGGRCHEGEIIEQTLMRELEEEIGITEFELINFLDSVPGREKGDIVHIFHATTKADFINKEPDKFVEWRWFELHELPEQVGSISSDALRSYLNSDD